jgi:hypothetical protein
VKTEKQERKESKVKFDSPGEVPADPYAAEVGKVNPISPDLLRPIFQQLPPVPKRVPQGQRVLQFEVDTKVLGLRTEELRQVGITLYKPGITPSRDAIEEWTVDLSQQLGVVTTQIRVLGNSTFLVAFDTVDSREKVLQSTPLMFNSRMVLVQAYDPTIDIAELQVKATVVWVDLVMIHPILEAEANQMLASVGPVLHLSIRLSRSKSQNI